MMISMPLASECMNFFEAMDMNISECHHAETHRLA